MYGRGGGAATLSVTPTWQLSLNYLLSLCLSLHTSANVSFTTRKHPANISASQTQQLRYLNNPPHFTFHFVYFELSLVKDRTLVWNDSDRKLSHSFKPKNSFDLTGRCLTILSQLLVSELSKFRKGHYYQHWYDRCILIVKNEHLVCHTFYIWAAAQLDCPPDQIPTWYSKVCSSFYKSRYRNQPKFVVFSNINAFSVQKAIRIFITRNLDFSWICQRCLKYIWSFTSVIRQRLFGEQRVWPKLQLKCFWFWQPHLYSTESLIMENQLQHWNGFWYNRN